MVEPKHALIQTNWVEHSNVLSEHGKVDFVALCLKRKSAQLVIIICNQPVSLFRVAATMAQNRDRLSQNH